MAWGSEASTIAMASLVSNGPVGTLKHMSRRRPVRPTSTSGAYAPSLDLMAFMSACISSLESRLWGECR